MEIQVLASSSEGNAYIIGDGATMLLIECGIPWKEIQRKNDFVLPDACLVSHSHGDHAKSVKDILRLGVPCYMSEETAQELNVAAKVWGAYLVHQQRLRIGTMIIQPLKLEHDVPCLGYYIYSAKTRETLFFATDTCTLPYAFGGGLDYIMVEANYDIDILNDRIMNGYIAPEMKRRLARSHMEIGNTIRWLRKQNLYKTKRIYLLHLSHGSSNADDFKRRVQEVTGVPTTIA